MLKIHEDLFSRTAMTAVGLLLAVTVVWAVVSLWEVAVKRWFG